MNSYYIYGRTGAGYGSWAPGYTESDMDAYFSKLTDVSPVQDDTGYVTAEKRYIYQIFSAQKKPCVAVGKTSYIWPNESRISGDRGSVFSFQYLLDDQERKNFLSNPELVKKYSYFPSTMDDVCNTEGNIKFDIASFMDQGSSRDYEIGELLAYFGLTGERLKEFVYSFLLYRAGNGGIIATYIVLPENTKEATDKAFALMKAVYKMLPETLIPKSGFATLATSVNEFISSAIQYRFLLNTEDVLQECRNRRDVFVFNASRESGVIIPASLRQVVDEMAAALLRGEQSLGYLCFKAALDKYYYESAEAQIGTKEYEALNSFCRNFALLESGDVSWFRSDREVWENVDFLRRMVNERTALWNGYLKADLESYIKALFEKQVLTGDNAFERVLEEYEKYPEFRGVIESYFFNKVKSDYTLLEQYINYLEKCPKLQVRLSEMSESILIDSLREGTINESMYPTLMNLYCQSPEFRTDIREFFEKLIVSEASYTKVKGIVTASKTEELIALWTRIKQNVWLDNLPVAKKVEETCIRRIFQSDMGDDLKLKNLWKILKEAKSLNEEVVLDPVHCRLIRDEVRCYMMDGKSVPTVKALLGEMQRAFQELHLPSIYQSEFAGLSGRFLETNMEEICESQIDPSLYANWPFLSANDRNLTKIQIVYQQQVKEQRVREAAEKCRQMQIQQVLPQLKNPELLDYVKEHEEKPFVKMLLRSLENQVKEAGKKDEILNRYDYYCFALLKFFPEQRDYISAYVMTSVYGGVSALSCIARYLEKDGIYTVEYQEAFNYAIRWFFNEYKMSKTDKDMIKAEKNFLRSLGINDILLLKKE